MSTEKVHDEISFNATREDIDLIDKIVTRVEGIARRLNHMQQFDRQTHVMDLIACHVNGCPLKLKEMLETERDSDVIHDVYGLNRHLNRTTGKLEDCFLPRFADMKKIHEAEGEEEEEEVQPTYEVIRFYRDSGEREVLRRGLTRREAQEHCKDPETSSTTCTTQEGRERTEQKGPWFDGFEEE